MYYFHRVNIRLSKGIHDEFGPMKIRAYLFSMALCILAPVVAFSAAALNMLLESERITALKGLQETARATALVIDRELLGAEAALKVLAGSPYLATGDMQSFYGQAGTADRGEGSWTVLLDENGQQLINTHVPFGTVLPTSLGKPDVAVVLRSKQTLVSDLLPGPLAKASLSAIGIPVVLSGERKYVLGIVFEARFFEKRLKEQQIASGRVVALIDRKGNFVARTRNAEALAGKPARPELVEAASHAALGLIRHKTWEGVDSYDAYTHSAISGWTVAVATPASDVEASARSAITVAALGLLAALGCAAVAAALFGGYLFRSIHRAALSASLLGKGHTPPPATSSVQEVQQLNLAIDSAARVIADERDARSLAEAERERLLLGEIQARRNAETENAAKDQFLAMLGHEIRNPLSAIHTAATLIGMETRDNPRLSHAREILERQSHNLSKIVDDLLDVTRVSMGKVNLRPAPVDLAELVRACVDGIRLTGRALDRDIVLNCEEAWVSADRTRLEQVINNLLINAIKYTPARGSIHIGVGKENAQAIVTVEDTGIGVAPDLLPRIFDLFVQAPATLDRAQGGLGIGLTLVRQIVALHGGTVEARSPGIGLGSTFIVRLPFASRPEPAPQTGKGSIVEATSKVLLIEDNADSRTVIAMMLAAHGHHVLEAENGDEGIGLAALERPDVAIIDIGLPGMTGYEIARKLKADTKTRGIRLIALTGYGQDSDRASAIEAGFDRHLVKPATLADLLDSVGGKRP